MGGERLLDMAEDAVQEAYLVLMEKWAEYDPARGIYPWVRRMVDFKVKEARRRTRKTVLVADPELDALVQQATSQFLDSRAAEDQASRVQALEHCMRSLSRGARDLLVRYYWKGQSCEAISQSVRKSANAIWLSLSRIRKKLRECMSHRLSVGVQ